MKQKKQQQPTQQQVTDQQKVDACAKELGEVMKKHGCFMEIQFVQDMVMNQPVVRARTIVKVIKQ
jgi:MarR-like DNA-binding transcriptional regulator SgrR of sgrS sRNA